MADGTVLHLTVAPGRGGAEVVAETLALGARRYRAVLGAPAGAAHVARWRAAGLAVLDLPPAPRFRHVLALRRHAEVVAAAMTGAGIDIVHTHGTGAQWVGAPAAARIGRPVVWHLHDIYAGNWTADGLLQRRAAARPPARAIAISRAVADSWRPRVGAGRLVLIPNGVSLAPVPPAGRPAEPFVVWCGRLQRWKGADTFLDVAAAIRRVVPAVRFAIVGDALFGLDTDWPGRLRAQAASMGLAPVVDWVGAVDDARPWLSAADVVVHCSHRPEPFGLVVAEAMAQGTPVVAFRQGGPAEIIEDGLSGRLVDPADVAGMADAVVTLLRDETVRLRFGEAARARVTGAYSAEAMSRQVESAYDLLRTSP